ncbi:sushi, von Willebrand factor type A, EGF and pentraxin domain-containing protein 1-like [Halichondria panicea]|uniref:sushi, von Willebrand factor type A, EGF and pentraxin domain-containing protein 1-like n=1 Tax=Halichondria panicea TaxID=6063 RepID=UPI00312B4562
MFVLEVCQVLGVAAMETQGGVQLLLLLYVVSTCWGQQVYLTLGSGPNITNNNTEILMTDIGEDALGGLPSLACHTDLTACCRSVADNNGMGGLGQWRYPDGSELVGNGASLSAGQQFFMVRNGPQLIRLSRRDGNNPLSPTGSYCCTIPTTEGDMTLCVNLVVCLSLPLITNGMISYSALTLGASTVATYTCDTGYILNGDATKTCGSDGIWSGLAPIFCQVNVGSATCFDNLPAITNGGITYAGGSINNRTVATYSCFSPYTLVGVPVRTCQSDGTWSSSTAPVCQLITCSDLPSLTNGIVDYGGGGSTNSRPVDTVATYSCNFGYTINGGSTRTCRSDENNGVWSGSAPTCQQILCSDLPSLINGMITYSAGGSINSRLVGSTATYSCDNGYRLVGETMRTCGSGGSWTESAPVCHLITCSDLPSLTNGVVDYGAGSTNNRPVDTVATYSCNPGYTFNGGSTRTCEIDGNNGMWSGSAPTCQQIPCFDLPSLTNGMITYSAGGSTNIRPVGSTATYSCDNGYRLVGEAMRTCGSGISWSGSVPVCQQTCFDLQPLMNGAIAYDAGLTDNRPLNTTATSTCDNDYILIGVSFRVCQNDGTWSGSTPTCQANTGPTNLPPTDPPPTTCSDLIAPTNGMISYNIGTVNLRPVDTVATYTCVTGYTLNGDITRTCDSDGMWSGSATTCQLICSDLPSLINGIISYTAGSINTRPVGSTATHSCNNGYRLVGEAMRTCGSGGSWGGSAPVCQQTCFDLQPLINGAIAYDAGLADSRPINTTATSTCDNDYILIGVSFRVCQNDGTWSGSAPTCHANTGPTDPPPTTCSDLTALTNGMIGYNMGTVSPKPVGTVATYTCNPGYILNGGTTRTCGSDGVWSESVPVCQPICSDLLSLPNGAISYSSMGSTDIRPINTIATHSCNDGYTLNGDTTRTCGSDGVWNGSVPTCQLICEDLLPLTNGMISYSMGSTDIRPINTIATHSCNDGYTLNGDSVRVCQNDRTWSGSTPTCRVSCGPPPSIDNGSSGQPTNTMIGGEVTYTCETGFIFIGFEMITCLNTGNWSSLPSCQTPPPVYLSLSSTNYLSGLSEIPLSSVGEGRSLVCHTDLAGCCDGNTGDWYYPNGSVVMEDGALYVRRGHMSVSLMSGTATAPGGLYCCVVPTSGGMSTACIVLASSTDESSPSDNTGAVVGGVVVALVVVVVTGVVIVTYLVLRYKRGGKMTVPHGIPLAYLDQGTANTFENSGVYEEIPEEISISNLTHNDSYLTVGGRGNTEAPAGGIYDN